MCLVPLQLLFGSTLAKIELDILDRDDSQRRRCGRQQSVVGIAQFALGEDHGLATMHDARPADHLAEAYRAQKAHLELDRGGELAGFQGDGHGWTNGGIKHLRDEATGDASSRIEAFWRRGELHGDGPTLNVQLDAPPAEELALGGPGKRLWTKCHRGSSLSGSVFSVTGPCAAALVLPNAALQGTSSDTPALHNQNPEILDGPCRAGRGPRCRDGLPESAMSAGRRRTNPRRG